MKLATLKEGGRDGILVVVSHDLSRLVSVPKVASTLQHALDSWGSAKPLLAQVYADLNSGRIKDTSVCDSSLLSAPLPRAFQLLGGSAYPNHAIRMRRARGAEVPQDILSVPLMYQGASDTLSGPVDLIRVEDESWCADFEAELAVITTDVPQGATPAEAGRCIALVMLCNDIGLSRLEREELPKGLGFVQSKLSSAFSPVAVTTDEIGAAWKDAKVCLPVKIHLNDHLFGQPDAGLEMAFDFSQLISHAARARRLLAGTIIGSGTISNSSVEAGYASLAERRAVEIATTGLAQTPFLKYGDRVRMEMFDKAGRSIFGRLDQEVVRFVKNA